MQCSSVGTRPENQVLIERQRFDTEKDRLAGEIFKVVYGWIVKSSTKLPDANKELAAGTAIYYNKNKEPNESGYFELNERQLLAYVTSGIDGKINQLKANKTGFAAYKFFHARLVEDYTLATYGALIKETEQITDLNDSQILKTASLAVLQLSVSKVDSRKFMLQGDKSQWWV